MWPVRLHLRQVSLPTVEAHLVHEEAQLRLVNEDASQATLLLWELPTYAVVVGRSNVIDSEVDTDACAADGVPIFRRISGGGAVVIGPGCLCYALTLPIGGEHRRLGVPAVTAGIMHRLAAALSDADRPVTVCGVSDLVADGRKFSGNSQRWLRNALLHHGTVLSDFDLDRVGRYLKPPSRQPVYRGQRSHAEFVANLATSRAEIVRRLICAWNAQ